MCEKMSKHKIDKELIDGVGIIQLKVIPDERGRLGEILRSDDILFRKFGQVYFTTTYSDVVKAWHFHKKQWDNVICIKGCIKLALYDNRDDSPTKGNVNQFYIGEHHPLLIAIPPGVYHGWMCVSDDEAYIINIPSEVYDYSNPDEHREDPHINEIPYEWERKDG